MQAQAQPKSARVLIVDSQPLVRYGLAQLLHSQTDLCLCGETGGMLSARAYAADLHPDLVVLGLKITGGDGFDLIKEFHGSHRSLPILVLADYEDAQLAERVLRAGARGFVTKREPIETVLGAIRTVLSGEMAISPKIAIVVLRRFLQTSPQAEGKGIEQLTDREFQVLQLLGSGMATRMIAVELKLSFKTIETHRENIKRKLGLHDASALVHFATNWLNSHSQAQPSSPLEGAVTGS